MRGPSHYAIDRLCFEGGLSQPLIGQLLPVCLGVVFRLELAQVYSPSLNKVLRREYQAEPMRGQIAVPGGTRQRHRDVLVVQQITPQVELGQDFGPVYVADQEPRVAHVG